MHWHKETHITHKETDKSSWTKRGSSSLPRDWGSTASCKLSSQFVSCHGTFVKNAIPMAWPRWHWITDNPSECTGVNFKTRVCVCLYWFLWEFYTWKGGLYIEMGTNENLFRIHWPLVHHTEGHVVERSRCCFNTKTDFPGIGIAIMKIKLPWPTEISYTSIDFSAITCILNYGIQFLTHSCPQRWSS